MTNKPVQSKKETFNRQLKLKKKSNYNISQETIPKEIFNNQVKVFTESLLFKYCNFQGLNLKCHFQSKAHLMPSETAKLDQSYLTHQVNSLTKVSKLKQNPPALCSKCHLFF